MTQFTGLALALLKGNQLMQQRKRRSDRIAATPKTCEARADAPDFQIFRVPVRRRDFVALIGAAGLAYVIWKYSRDLPDHAQLENYEPPVMTRVHAGDGGLLAEYARERRLYLPIQTMPRLLISAYLSAEDKNFYSHKGIDPEGIARAIVTNYRNRGARQQGASTITQQVAKNFLLTSEQSYERKIREALIALRLESHFSKDKILELYLNDIFLGTPIPGRNIHGVAAAALEFFGKSVHELSLPEMAYLAALPKGPNNYHPIEKREAAIIRRNWVIDRMVENGFVTRADGDKAKAEPLVVNMRSVSANLLNSGFFAEEVRRELTERYGSKKVLEGGLSVRTTLDPKLQVMARKALIWTASCATTKPAAGAAPRRRSRPPATGARRSRPSRSTTTCSPGRAVACCPSPIRRPESACSRGVCPAPDRARAHPGRHSGGSGALDAAEAGAGAFPGRRDLREPVENRPGQFRLRQFPEISGAAVVMDPHTGRVSPWSAASRSTSRSSTARRRRCGSRAPPTSLRLRDGARQRLYAVVHRRGRADRDRPGRHARRLAAGELRRRHRRPPDAALRHRAVQEPDDHPTRARRRHAADRRVFEALRHL